jgi:hypothetical protein
MSPCCSSISPLHGVVQRAHGRTFAHDLQGDALSYTALGTAVVQQRLVRPRQDVDEARRDRETLRVHLERGAGRREVADERDGITDHADVRLERRSALPIVDGASTDDRVEDGRTGGAAGEHEAAEQVEKRAAHGRSR